MGIDAHRRGASPPPAPHDASLVPRDRGAAVRLAQHGEDAGDLGLPQARRLEPERGHRPGGRSGARRRRTGGARAPISPAQGDVPAPREASNA